MYKSKSCPSAILIDVVDISNRELHDYIPLLFIDQAQYINVVKFIHRCLIRNGSENEKQEGIRTVSE